MTTLTHAEWEQINELIKKLYLMDHNSLLDFVSNELMSIIPSSNSMYHYYIEKGNKIVPYNYQSTNIAPEILEIYKSYEDVDYICWYTDVPQQRVYRDTDLINEDLRLNTELMKNWLIPNNLFYSLGSTIAYDNHAYGAISLFKGKEEGDFTDADIKILELINEHLSIKFHFDISGKEYEQNGSDLSSLSSKYKLTSKEHEIILLIESGSLRDTLSNKLYISDNTLKKHLYNIYRKLKINKFEELIQIINDINE